MKRKQFAIEVEKRKAAGEKTMVAKFEEKMGVTVEQAVDNFLRNNCNMNTTEPVRMYNLMTRRYEWKREFCVGVSRQFKKVEPEKQFTMGSRTYKWVTCTLVGLFRTRTKKVLYVRGREDVTTYLYGAIAEYVIKYLESLGYTVISNHNGAEGIHIFWKEEGENE